MQTVNGKIVVYVLLGAVLAGCSAKFDQQDTAGQVPPAPNEAPQTRPAQVEASTPAGGQAVPQPVSNADANRVLRQVQESRITDRLTASAGYGASYLDIRQREDVGRENYAGFEDNGIRRTLENPVSTFSIDVDTGAYSNVRRYLSGGGLPPRDAVRTEELVNYFSYEYPRSDDDERPFALYTEIAASPWNPDRYLLHIGLHADQPGAGLMPDSNLVFLVDVSGSMQSPDKLELLKTSLKMLSRQLGAGDRVSLVVYAGASGVVLEPTQGNDAAAINAALERLTAGGSTNGAAGIQLAYAKAREAFIEGGINRVILATDGDFNVGMVNFEDLKSLVSAKRETGISLTTLGFGTGNYNDHLMEQLADAGNGNYAYIDTINEARKVLVDERSSTLQTVASDVKIQLEFNPALVAEYRLIGYENRALAREDFNNDGVDAGEIGAGHSVTALYEVALAGSAGISMDPLRYGRDVAPEEESNGELAYLKLRYKEPGTDSSVLMEQAIRQEDVVADIDATSASFRFAAAVAGMGQLLRGNERLDGFGYDEVIALAGGARERDEFGYRAEFVNLARTARALAAH